MTTAGRGNRLLAVAASLALHAGVFALAWPRPEAAPSPVPAVSLQVTLLAPPAPALATPRPPTAGAAKTRQSRPGTEVAPPAPPTPDTRSESTDRAAAETAADAVLATSPAVTTAAATAGEPAAATGPDSDGEVLAALKRAFTAHFHYPPLARRQGWEGEVTLALRVETDGRLTGIHVVGSSGHRVLDNAAVTTLERARALPLPGGTLDNGLDMLLPVQYRLLDARV